MFTCSPTAKVETIVLGKVLRGKGGTGIKLFSYLMHIVHLILDFQISPRIMFKSKRGAGFGECPDK